MESEREKKSWMWKTRRLTSEQTLTRLRADFSDVNVHTHSLIAPQPEPNLLKWLSNLVYGCEAHSTLVVVSTLPILLSTYQQINSKFPFAAPKTEITRYDELK